jgi:hypothetical protein
MSKLSDYSKFDHLDDSSDEEEEILPKQEAPAIQEQTAVSAIHEQAPDAATRKDPDTGRYVFEYRGTKVYEWEQSLEGTLLVVANAERKNLRFHFSF